MRNTENQTKPSKRSEVLVIAMHPLSSRRLSEESQAEVEKGADGSNLEYWVLTQSVSAYGSAVTSLKACAWWKQDLRWQLNFTSWYFNTRACATSHPFSTFAELIRWPGDER
jgi:hypothetical protein